MRFLLLLSICASWSILYRAIEVSAGGECSDDESYRYYGDDWKDCKWVQDNKRCNRHDNKDNKHVGKHYCPKSCGLCAQTRNAFIFNPDTSTEHGVNNQDGGDDFHYEEDDDENDDENDDDDDHWNKDDDEWLDADDNWHHEDDAPHTNDDGFNFDDYLEDNDGEKFFCYKYDDEDFRYGGYHWKDCEWVAREGYCNKEYDGKNVGNAYCPLSCGRCDNTDDYIKKPTRKPTRYPTRYPTTPTRTPTRFPTRRPTTPTRTPTRFPTRRPTTPTRQPSTFCYDDIDYRYDGDFWKDCSWVSKNNRCDDYRNDVCVGDYYCPRSCGRCSSTPCQGDLSLERYCYGENDVDDINVFFKNCNAQPSDWVGIYNPHYNTNYGNTQSWWGSPYMWQYTCGSTDCDFEKDEGTLCFEDWWFSLQPGEYRAYLFGDHGYNVKAESHTFKISNCNGNGNPTRKPTRMPTPSHCPSSVQTEELCYKNRYPEKLRVFFDNCHPEGRDWIGIFQSHNHKNYGTTQAWWGESYLWTYACGSQNCNSNTGGGTINFDSWWSKLEAGSYKAYLFKNDGYQIKAESEIFHVNKDC